MPTPPNNFQQKILQSENEILLVHAVAGSGKTTTLSMFANRELQQGRSPRNIMGLCFSPSARVRFQEKLREEAELGASVFVMTIEDFARRQIELLAQKDLINLPYRHHDVEGIRGELVAAAGRVWARYDAKGIAANFDFSVDDNNQYLADLAQQLLFQKASLRSHEFEVNDLLEDDLQEFSNGLDRPAPEIEIFREYEIKRHPYVDEFLWQGPHEAVSDLVFLLKARPSLLNDIFSWSLYLVDEWHDINAAEFELIRILRRKAKLVVVSDKNQTINVERGANAAFSGDHFVTTYAKNNPAILPLGTSYRYGASIAKLSDQLVKNDCLGHPDKESRIHRLSYESHESSACAMKIAEQIERTLADNPDHDTSRRDFAIVLRDVDQSVEIEAALIERKIPYKCDGFETFLMLPEILMLRAILHYVSGQYETLRSAKKGDEEEHTCREMVLALSRYFYVIRDPKNWYFESDEKKSFLGSAQKAIAENPSLFEDFFEGVLLRPQDTDSQMVQSSKQIFGKAISALKERVESATAYELLNHLAKSIDLNDATSRAFVDRNRVNSARRSIDAFMRFVERNGQDPTKEFLEKIKKMQNNVSGHRKSEHLGKIGKKQRLVRVTTIQAAKGREWKYVFMPYLSTAEFYRSKNIGQELRFLYVGVSRAMRELFLFEPDVGAVDGKIPQLTSKR